MALRRLIARKAFKGETVIVDDTWYANCVFDNCILIYRPEKEHRLSNCQLNGSDLREVGRESLVTVKGPDGITRTYGPTALPMEF